MKKRVISRLTMIIFVVVLLSLIWNYVVQLDAAKERMHENSQSLFKQVEMLLRQNEFESEEVSREFRDMCFIKAEAAAYMIQHNPEAINDPDEMTKIAELLQVDEFHIFDAEGNLYAGSEPRYFGMNMRSGEQISFFLPMLEDKDIKLCQDITPNTAEEKPMQYAAVWREDGKEIVQIGMEPDRVLDAMEKVQLSYVFSLLTVDSGAQIYAIEPVTYKILGTTVPGSIGLNAKEMGFVSKYMKDNTKVHSMTIGGIPSFCVFTGTDNMILARVTPSADTYDMLNKSALLLALYLLVIALVMILVITLFLNRSIINRIEGINDKMSSIAKGNWALRMEEEKTPELNELGNHINELVSSLLSMSGKYSKALDTVDYPIGIFEYAPTLKRVLVTNKVKEILHMDNAAYQKLTENPALFAAKIQDICKHPFETEKNIYALDENEEHYIRIERLNYEKSTMGILVDVTEEVAERMHLEHERDVDILTGIYSRRAFFARLEKLQKKNVTLHEAVMIIIDADGLKTINDSYGHQNGDRYLKKIAEELQNCSAGRKIVARLGGDEFIVFIHGYETKRELEAYIKEILLVREAAYVKLDNDMRIPLQFSMGYAFYGEEAKVGEELIKLADDRMYEEKKQRKLKRK